MDIPSPDAPRQIRVRRIQRTAFVTLLAVSLLSGCTIMLASRFGFFRGTPFSLYPYLSQAFVSALHTCLTVSWIGVVGMLLSSPQLWHRYRHTVLISFLLTILALI